MRPRVTLRFYIVLLCSVYFAMLYVFYGKLQVEIDQISGETLTGRLLDKGHTEIQEKSESKRKVLETRPEESKPIFRLVSIRKPNKQIYTNDRNRRLVKADQDDSPTFLQEKDLTVMQRSAHRQVNNSKLSLADKYDDTCFMSAVNTGRQFQALEPDSFVYAAYLDERNGKTVIRIMSIHSLEKKNRHLDVYCHFGKPGGKAMTKKADFYELCENHGKKYGGFILSCNVPTGAYNICVVTVSMEIIPVHYQYIPPKTSIVTVPVTKLKPGSQVQSESFKRPVLNLQTSSNISLDSDSHSSFRSRNNSGKIDVQFQFSICVPPLFGNIDLVKLVEFIELNRLLGVQHFIFYLTDIKNADLLKILDYYKKRNVVTAIEWKLPSVILKNKIWYNGQLSMHNDCVYRSMSISRFIAIIDIDEVIVPHNGKTTLLEAVGDLFKADVCGISFDSAFYDPNFSRTDYKTKLLTISRTGRSSIFSKVRTKVMMDPRKIFEVGIHHISKPSTEDLKVLKVNTSTAFLHHYRTCVPNFGMKCGTHVEDQTVLKYRETLSVNVEKVFRDALFKDIIL